MGWSGLTSGNYSIGYAGGTLTIGKAELLARADDQGRAYGQTNPVFTITYTGLSPIVNTGTAIDMVFDLPAVSSIATLGDDGTTGNTLSRLSSSPGRCDNLWKTSDAISSEWARSPVNRVSMLTIRP